MRWEQTEAGRSCTEYNMHDDQNNNGNIKSVDSYARDSKEGEGMKFIKTTVSANDHKES